MKIIGITGTIGAGKGTIVEYLTRQYGFIHYSVRQVLIEEIKRRGLPVDRDSMFAVANELRAANSPSWVIEQLYKRAVQNGHDAIIESVRNAAEADFLSKVPEGALLFAVDADPKIRHGRVLSRKSETDNVTFEQFIEKEQREMNSNDPTRLNLSACIAAADHVFMNNGSVEELQQKVDAILA